MAHRLGVDVGGTFTDLLLVHDETGSLHRVKTPSTPSDPSQGVLVGVRRICEESGVPPEELRYVMHGTTVATNALLEAKGARVGLITTRGFKQILHLAASQRPDPRSRARDQGDHPLAAPRLPGDDLVRRPAGVPRVRAHAHRVHELVRAAEG